MKAIIAAAGTGGHINPAIAIANKIKEEEPESEIIFIGTNRGLENDLVPRAGYKLKQIEAYGLGAKFTIENMKKMYKTYTGYWQAKKVIKEFKPDIVIGTGGYICGPTIMAANKLKIPTILHESNAFPGKAIKMLAKKTDVILVSFKEAIERIKGAKRIVYTGTPIKIHKKDFSQEKISKIKRELGLQVNKPMVLVFGGSQGAQCINEAITSIIKKKNNSTYQIMWAAGPEQYKIIKDKLEKDNIYIDDIEGVRIVPYIYNMEDIMNVSDVIVARSGAMTITEIANLGKPSILIPLPNVSNNHQLYNAKVLENIGAAKIILNKDLTGEILNSQLEKIIENSELMRKMGENARKNSTETAQEKIFKEIKKLVK